MAGDISERGRQLLDAKVGRRTVLLKGGALGLLGTVAAACGDIHPFGIGATPSPTRTPEITPNPTGSAAAAAPSASGPETSASAKPSTSPSTSPSASPAATPAKTDSAAATTASAAPEVGEVKLPTWEKGKPIIHGRVGPRGNEVVQQFDVGTFGPDVDAVCGFDFKGDIPTGATVISRPAAGTPASQIETRVVFIKRTDLDYVQINDALGGDESHIQKARDLFPTAKEADENLDRIARLHARNSGHTHQKVVYLGDLGLFEKEWGQQERPLLNRIIWAQRPARPEIGIQESNFVNPRRFT